MHSITIRKIQQEDNAAIARIIRGVFDELGIPKVGTAYADPQLDHMFETYNVPKSVYFVLESDGAIIGGAGIGPLENGDENVCELQKMYFHKDARGLGFGSLLIDKCLFEAKELGYEKCYLETLTEMVSAQKLYKKSGFEYISEPMGNTGHSSCPVWMLKVL